MARKKVDKTTVEYLVSQLFHLENFTGFQLTAGRTPRAIAENEDFTLCLSLNFDQLKSNCVIDCCETDLEDIIMLKFFPEYEKYCQVLVSKEAIKNLQDIFRRLGYEVEEANYAGEWKWFRVHCKPEEVKSNVERLTEALRGFDRRKISAG